MEQLYKTTNYTIGSILTFLDNGTIGLPDLQRPFVWNTSQVRDLFDSLYQGYPVGFFLLWDIDDSENTHSIGGDKENIAKKVIIDGQQRLTSLYSIIKGERVKDKDGNWIKIRLSFNPIENKIEVTTPAHERTPEWISNITNLWTKDNNSHTPKKINKNEYKNENKIFDGEIFDLVELYFEGIEEKYEFSKEKIKEIKDRIKTLYEIKNFNFTSLEISSNVGIEEISDIFMRINSKGKQLSQADFILTLLSVYWEEGREKIEDFCYNKKSPFNHLLSPLPDDIVKVLVSYTFFRGRLKDMYNLLRGRDTETRKFDENLKIERLELLKINLEKVIDVGNWAGFFKIIIGLGFKSRRLINSDNTLLFTYILYLLGKNKFKVEYNVLERYIGKYYIFTLLSGKYSTSTESTLEEELKTIEKLKTSGEFLEYFDNQITINIGEDFWNNKLIDEIKSSYSKNTVYMVYLASNIFKNTRILLSNNLFGDLINDELILNKQLLDWHHIFPRNYLNTFCGINDIKDTNQVANMVYLGYNDNIKISDKSPSDYYYEMVEKYGKEKVNKGLLDNDIPLNFYELTYEKFLVERRKLIVNSVRKYFEIISNGGISEENEDIDILSIIDYGESNKIEFKTTLRWDIRESCVNKKLEFIITKTISAFLNSNGGILLIGVEDNGNIFGLESDYSTLSKQDSDGFLLHIDNLIDNNLGKEIHKFVKVNIQNIDGKNIAVVKVDKSNKPIFILNEGTELFFIRAGSSTRPMNMKEFNEYKETNW